MARGDEYPGLGAAMRIHLTRSKASTKARFSRVCNNLRTETEQGEGPCAVFDVGMSEGAIEQRYRHCDFSALGTRTWR